MNTNIEVQIFQFRLISLNFILHNLDGFSPGLKFILGPETPQNMIEYLHMA